MKAYLVLDLAINPQIGTKRPIRCLRAGYGWALLCSRSNAHFF
jgi:hypothetical protein